MRRPGGRGGRGVLGRERRVRGGGWLRGGGREIGIERVIEAQSLRGSWRRAEVGGIEWFIEALCPTGSWSFAEVSAVLADTAFALSKSPGASLIKSTSPHMCWEVGYNGALCAPSLSSGRPYILSWKLWTGQIFNSTLAVLSPKYIIETLH